MDLPAFRVSLTAADPPPTLSPVLRALYRPALLPLLAPRSPSRRPCRSSAKRPRAAIDVAVEGEGWSAKRRRSSRLQIGPRLAIAIDRATEGRITW
jgi:hypothetical protein